MHDSLKHLRLVLAQILFEVRWRVVNDYASASEPVFAANAELQSWVTAATNEFDNIGGLPPAGPTGHAADGGVLDLFGQFVRGDPLIAELMATATWWAGADRGTSWWPWPTSGQLRRNALASAMWHLKRVKTIVIAERAGEWVGPPALWEAGNELAAAVGDAAQRFG
jgi:hypothetical protein